MLHTFPTITQNDWCPSQKGEFGHTHAHGEGQEDGDRDQSDMAASQGTPEVKVLVAQLCLTLCNPKDCSLPGPGLSVHGILQARILEWVAISSSRISSQSRNCRQILYCLSHKGNPMIADKSPEARGRGLEQILLCCLWREHGPADTLALDFWPL